MLLVELGEHVALERVPVLVERVPLLGIDGAGLEPAEALVNVRGEAAAGVLTVVWHVQPDFDLFTDDGGDAVVDRGFEGRGVVRLVEGPRFHAFDDLAGADQATGVGGEDALRAAVHGERWPL